VFTILHDLKLDARRCGADADNQLLPIAAKALKIAPRDLLSLRILRRTIDSRRNPVLIYTLAAEVADDAAGNLPAASDAELKQLHPVELELPDCRIPDRPVVVGTGPAGIFAAYALALAGAKPLVIDRGFEVDERYRRHRLFLQNRQLNEESNLLIGEGGAGTFSDGKLYTGTKDPSARFVLETMVGCGAAPEILYHSRPHVGSDRLREVCAGLRRKIIGLGGSFRFGCGITGIRSRNGHLSGLVCADGSFIETTAAIIAPGLGGRTLTRQLAKELLHSIKPFQMGCRIEHPQEFIDRCQYHGGRPASLGAAEYHLVSRAQLPEYPGVASFCMCPGGTIVNASAWSGHSTSNGMSDMARSGEFANGCIITTLPADYFGTLENADRLTAGLERALFEAGGRDYTLPAQDAAAFISGSCRLSRSNGAVETGTVPARIDNLLPAPVVNALRRGVRDFDRRMPGFIRLGRFVGAEAGVSSPLRFFRNEEDLCSSLPGLWLAGEGVGAAGGIVSAACDGLRCAIKMLGKEY